MLAAAYFSRHEEALCAQAAASGSLQSTTSTGRAREYLIRDFFSDHVPQRINIVGGEVFDASGDSTGEADVIFADSRSAAFGIGGESMVPVEAAVGVCEVKSSLSGNHLDEAIAKIVQVKSLSRTDYNGFFTYSSDIEARISIPPSSPMGYVIAYDAPNLGTVMERMQNNPDWFQGDVMRYGPDMICVLQSGMIVKNDRHIYGGPQHADDVDFFVISDAVGLRKLLGHVNENLARYGRLEYDMLPYYMN